MRVIIRKTNLHIMKKITNERLEQVFEAVFDKYFDAIVYAATGSILTLIILEIAVEISYTHLPDFFKIPRSETGQLLYQQLFVSGVDFNFENFILVFGFVSVVSAVAFSMMEGWLLWKKRKS